MSSASPAQHDPAADIVEERRADAKFTVVLDIDATLVSSIPVGTDDDSVDMEGESHQVSFIHDGRDIRFNTWCRPFVSELFDFFREHRQFEVILFTKAKDLYASQVRQLLDPKNEVIEYLICSDRPLKDLRLLDRKIETMCLVDDDRANGKNHRRIYIPVTPWTKEIRDDKELEALRDLFQSVVDNGEATLLDSVERYNRETLVSMDGVVASDEDQ